MITTDQLITAWQSYTAKMIAEGRRPYLLTMMFKHIPGSERTRMTIMARDIQERIYPRAVTRCVCNPRSPFQAGRLPIWLGFPDYPVAKKKKSSVHDVTVNDGLHFHAINLIHPESRLQESFVDHLVKWQDLYVRPERPLDRIHAEEIDSSPGYVVDYASRRPWWARLRFTGRRFGVASIGFGAEHQRACGPPLRSFLRSNPSFMTPPGDCGSRSLARLALGPVAALASSGWCTHSHALVAFGNHRAG